MAGVVVLTQRFEQELELMLGQIHIQMMLHDQVNLIGTEKGVPVLVAWGRAAGKDRQMKTDAHA